MINKDDIAGQVMWVGPGTCKKKVQDKLIILIPWPVLHNL